MFKDWLEIIIGGIVWFFIAIGVCSVIEMCAENEAEGRTFTVRELSFEMGKYTSDRARDSYLLTPQSGPLLHRTAMNWNVDLWCGVEPQICWFWDNTVLGKASQSRYRFVSWEFSNGLSFGPIDIYYYHHSQHMLEGVREDIKFPVEDVYMVRLNFILNPRRRY
jgi:hypothetical protein